MLMNLADTTYTAIIALIEDQGMTVGQRLPSEGQLAVTLGVSRTIVREALARLASHGVTEARRGSGSFVMRLPSELLKRHVEITQLPAAFGACEVRSVLEAEAARLAALRRSSADMATIDQRFEEFEHALHSSNPADVEDMALHRAIMSATGNRAFVATFETLSPDIGRIMKAGVDISRSRSAGMIAAILDEHRQIVDAIRAGDADRAALAMSWHLSQGRRRMMS